jgi:hypothetical protein
MRIRSLRWLLGAAAVPLMWMMPAPAQAAAIGAAFSSIYTLSLLPAPFGGPNYNLGGLAFEAGNSNVLMIGGGSDTSAATLQGVTVTRDPVFLNVTGFSGSSTLATSPDVDGGIAYGPGGVLFFTQYTDNTVGELKPGSVSPDKTIALPGVITSTGGLAFIPAGFPGAGNAAITSFNGQTICSAPVTADGFGTYDFGTCANTVSFGTTIEGIQYVPLGTPGFSAPSILVDLYSSGSTGQVVAYTLDSNGMPVLGSATPLLTGLGTAEGITIDPVTGDFLISEFTPLHNVYEVHPTTQAALGAPEPGTWSLIAVALIGLGCRLRR